MSYGATSPLGGIRIFYSSSILWDSDLSRLFGLNILLTLTLGSRTHFLPESPDITDDRLLRQKILRILLDVSQDSVPTALQFLTTGNPHE